MGGVRRLLALLLGAAAAAGLLAALWPGGSTARPRGVSASLSPRAPLFGDPVVAQISAPAGARIKASFKPFTVRAATHRHGTYTYTLECVSLACLPGQDGLRLVRLRPAVVRAPGSPPLAIAWPALRIGSRLTPDDLLHPRYRADVASPRPSSRFDPDKLGWGLTSGACVLLFAAVALGSSRLRARRPTLQLVAELEPEPSALERALDAVEQSLGGPAERRRAALDALAVALGDEGLAGRARTLAWSPEPPEPPAIRVLAHEAREALG
jgi:hypothetical protein